MKKELKKIKVVEHYEELFKKEDKTYYVRNGDNRSRLDSWRNSTKANGYKRSTSFPKFFRTASKNNYIRERSNFGRQNLNLRSNSRQGYG